MKIIKINTISYFSKLVVAGFPERNVSVVWLFMCESIEMVMAAVVLYSIGALSCMREREREKRF